MSNKRNFQHGAYQVMRLAKEGHLPDKRTRLGKAVEAVRQGIISHYGELNPLQQLTLFKLMPLVVFWFEHPMTTNKGKLAEDWKYIERRIDSHLELIEKQAASGNGKGKVPTIKEIIEQESKS